MSLFGDMSGDTSERVWKALADRTRRTILDILAERPHTTGELVARVDGLCRTAVMKHLDVLERAHLVLARREGRTRWNHLNPLPIQEVCDRWVGRHVRHLASAAVRLKAVAEGDGPDDGKSIPHEQDPEGGTDP